MKIDLVFHIFEQYLSLPEIQQLCASTIDQFNHIDVQQFLFHKQLSAFLQPHIAGIQIRPAFLCTQDGLFLFHASMCFWFPESSTSGTFFPCHTSGLEYCGCSKSSPWKDSVRADCSFPSTPGTRRATASTITMLPARRPSVHNHRWKCNL